MNRFVPPTVAGAATLTALTVLLFTSVASAPLLFAAAAGAPITVLLLLRSITDPETEGRSIWPSFAIGAVLVPIAVLALHGVFYAVGMSLIAPFADAGAELLDHLKADKGIVNLLTEYWAYVFIAELTVVAPLAEETTKPLGAVLRRPRTARDAFLFGAAAGTGFAVVENVMYASGWFWTFDYWLSISTMRMVGAGLHAFGAGLVAWGVFQLREGRSGRWRRLGLAYVVALAAHGTWNGTIAVAQVLYAGRSEFGAAVLPDDALAWGTALQAGLAVLGTVIAAALLMAGKRINEGTDPLRLDLLTDLARPSGIAAWAVLSTLVLIPSTIVVLVFPTLIAL